MRLIGIVFALIALLMVLAVGANQVGSPDVSQEVVAVQVPTEDNGGLYEPLLAFQDATLGDNFNIDSPIDQAITEAAESNGPRFLTLITSSNVRATETDLVLDRQTTTGKSLDTGDVSMVPA